MDLLNASKEELQDELTRLTGAKPKAALTKAELIDEIEKIAAANAGTPPAPPAPGADPEPPAVSQPPAPPGADLEEPALELGEDELMIVKKNADGDVIDRQTTTRDAWNLLPPHKFGFVIEEPAEAK